MHVCVTTALPVLQPSFVMAHISGQACIVLYAHRCGHCVGSIHARRHYRGDTRVGHAGLVQRHLYMHMYQYMCALNISSRALFCQVSFFFCFLRFDSTHSSGLAHRHLLSVGLSLSMFAFVCVCKCERVCIHPHFLYAISTCDTMHLTIQQSVVGDDQGQD